MSVSYFDLQAEEGMRQWFLPATQQFLQKCNLSSTPSSSSTAAILLYALIEAASLFQFDGSFTEIFYQLKRQQQPGRQGRNSLKFRFLQWFCLILPPILKHQKDGLHSYYYRDALLLGLDALGLVYKFLYLMAVSSYFSPWHHVLSIKFEKSKPAKYAICHFLLISILPFALFMRRLSLWWQSVASNSQSHLKLKLPAPPLFPIKKATRVTPNVCPLCEKNWQFPMVTKTGFIFCNNCIRCSLKLVPKCPLTDIPLDLSDVWPIYL
jgi:hypothetical protein